MNPAMQLLLSEGVSGPVGPGEPAFGCVSLLMHFEGANAGTVFTDVKSNTITPAGSPTTSTTQAKFGTTSLALNGTTDGLNANAGTQFAFGTGEFTLEAWVYITSYTTVGTVISCAGTSGDAGIVMYVNGTGQLALSTPNTGYGATGTVSLNTWTHVACSRTGTTLKGWINGVAAGSYSCSTDFTDNYCAIGKAGNASSQYLTGYVDDVRVTKAYGRYPAAFTAPTAAFYNLAGDPDWASVALLLHADGANGATTTTDESPTPATATMSGSATVSTTQSKFGGSSFLLTAGATDAIKFTSDARFNAGQTSYTIECWIRPTDVTGGAQQCIWRFNGAAQQNPYCMITGASIYVRGTNSGSNLVPVTAHGMSINTWYHLAVTKSGATWTVYINGVQICTSSAGTAVTDESKAFSVGSGVSVAAFVGNIDEVRLYAGLVKYTAAFTPIPAPFPSAL